jgi:hypothetical protein
MKLFILIIASVFALSLTGCSKHYEKTDTEQINLDSRGKNKLILDNISGSITIRMTDSEEIKITAKKVATVRKRDLVKPFDEIDIDISEEGEEIHIETVMNEIRRGLFSFDEKQEVDYEIYLPERFSIDVANVNGKIFVYDLKGDIRIENENGDITVKNNTGETIIDLVNGTVFSDLQATKGFHAEVINGKIFVNLGDSINALINSSSLNGNIETNDIIFKNVHEDNDNFRAVLGTGEYPINAKTVNGRIIFDKLKSSSGISISDLSNEEIYELKKKELEEAKKNLEKAQIEFEKAEKNYLNKNNVPADTVKTDSIKTL